MSQDSLFNEIVAAHDPEVQAIARQLRALIAQVHPEVVEVVWLRQKIAGYGVGPKKMSEHYSYIAPQTKHVNIGFNYGASLADPTGLLEGGGKLMRHVKVYTLAEVEKSGLRELLQAAVVERAAATGKRL